MRRRAVVLAALTAACGSSGEAPGAPIDAGSNDATSAVDGGASDAPIAPSDAGRDAGDARADANEPLDWRALVFSDRCPQTIWVGALGNPVVPSKSCNADPDCADPTLVCNPGNHLCTYAAPDASAFGWRLLSTETEAVFVPATWAGRFWPRTECGDFDAGAGAPACATGDCGGHATCPVGVGGAPPATLAELTLTPPTTPTAVDFYDVSNVDGANVPVAIVPLDGTYDATPPAGGDATYWCTSPGCTGAVADCAPLAPCPWNLDTTCPAELQASVNGIVVGCRSANQACAATPNDPALKCAAQRDLYACTPGGPNAVSGSCYANGATSTCCGCPSWSPAGKCQAHDPKWESPSLPETYAKVFKDVCPSAYAFPFDDPTSTFTCRGLDPAKRNAGYVVTFCP